MKKISEYLNIIGFKEWLNDPSCDDWCFSYKGRKYWINLNSGGVETDGWYTLIYETTENNDGYVLLATCETIEELINTKVIDGKSIVDVFDELEY